MDDVICHMDDVICHMDDVIVSRVITITELDYRVIRRTEWQKSSTLYYKSSEVLIASLVFGNNICSLTRYAVRGTGASIQISPCRW